MNNVMLVIVVIVAGFLINLGWERSVQVGGEKSKKEQVMLENQSLSNELNLKRTFKKEAPKLISMAFTEFVNEAKMFETYSGTKMNIVINGSKDNENIEDHYEITMFRHVKGLPITINVEKFSNETDMAEVLNDIYLLENRTDFKVAQILTENNELVVKGELYGV